jgi:hypothetical protein
LRVAAVAFGVTGSNPHDDPASPPVELVAELLLDARPELVLAEDVPELLAADDGLELALDEVPFEDMPAPVPAGLEPLLEAEPLVDDRPEPPVGPAPELPLENEGPLLAEETATSVDPPELAVTPPVVDETLPDGPTDPEFEEGDSAAGPAAGADGLPLPHAGATDMAMRTARNA